MKKVLCIGYGYVGNGAYKMFSQRYDTYVYDPYARLPGDVKSVDNVDENHYDLAIIGVPTSMKDNGECDTSLVEDSIKLFNGNVEVFLIKSTIQPGTTDRLKKKYGARIIFSPEYMGEGGYHSTYDFHTAMEKTPFVVLGGTQKDCDYVHDMMLPIVGPQKEWFYLKPTEAEIVKYMENTYFGVKVTFANEMFEICKTLGANWEMVRQAWAADPRVDIMHTAVFPEARGFAGKCLPKDLNALVYKSKDMGYNPEFLQQMLRSNAKFREDKELKKVSD